MKILVLGGSVFLGRNYVEEALKQGHEVTTFNRGRTAPDVPGVEAVHGDREVPADLERLVTDRQWDAVIDVAGFNPQVVSSSVRILNGHVDTYVFVSSISAYKNWPVETVDESSTMFDGTPEDSEGDYGFLKTGCERAVEKYFEGRTLIIQPGLIFGPYENINRLPWWLRRAAKGGRMLAPGDPDRPMQLVDARDIARFTLDQLAKGGTGRFLTSGVRGNVTYGEYLRLAIETTGSDATLEWVDDTFLKEHEVGMWVEMPLWAPGDPDWAGTWLPDSSKALAAGMVCRPVAETVRDTWAWLKDVEGPLVRYRENVPSGGMAPEREAELLAAWDARK